MNAVVREALEQAWRDDATALPDTNYEPAVSPRVFWACLALAWLAVLAALAIQGL